MISKSQDLGGGLKAVGDCCGATEYLLGVCSIKLLAITSVVFGKGM